MATAATQKVFVAGAGAIGLRTALELIRRNVKVVLHAPKHPLHPSTCSMGAGGLWMPFHCDDPRTNRWSIETLDELLAYSVSEKPEEKECVEIVPAVVLLRDHAGPCVDDFATYDYKAELGGYTETVALPQWTADPRLEFQHMTVEMLSWQNIVYQLRIPPEQELKEAGYLHSWLFRPPIVETNKMLEHLLLEVSSRAEEVNVETGVEFESIEHMREKAESLGCDTVINCTGLGSKQLCGDEELIGARGILLHFDRETCVRRPPIRDSASGVTCNDAVICIEDEPWATDSTPCYLIPRGDKIVVGGSYLENDAEASIRVEEKERLLLNAKRLGIDLDETTPIGEWVGFRPYRANVRIGFDDDYAAGVKVYHNYGHGGSGWTVNVGVAKECADAIVGKA